VSSERELQSRRLSSPWQVLGLLAVGLVAAVAQRICAQVLPSGSYESIYNQELAKRTQPMVNPGLYTYDRYFYHDPAISPYENLLRRGTIGGANYQLYVRPEEEARAAAEARIPTLNTGVGGYEGDRYASFYQNHFYGGWLNRP
jgi:hypothetical protein